MTGAALFAAGLGLLIVAGTTAAALRRPGAARPAMVLSGAAELAVGLSGLMAVAGQPWSLDLGDLLGYPTRLSADPLSGLFLAITGLVAAASCLVAAGPADRGPRTADPAVAAASALLLLGVTVTIAAADAFVLVLAWELLSFSFFLLTGARRRPAAVRASLLTYAFGKSSGGLLLLGLLLMAAQSGTLQLSGISAHVSGATHAVAYTLLLLAFGVKVGLLPVHIWLPDGYEAAPVTVRPLLAGVAVNAGFYGLWRTFDLLGAPPQWLIATTLLLAALTALLGIAHATVQTRLARVVAWSSVENAGLITVGLGVAMVGAHAGDQRLVAAGLLAGVLQTVTHAVAKALLFGSAAAFETAHGTDDLDRLRGSIWGSPYSGAGFVVGALTLAALPPTAGFVSEWFLLEALMQQFRVEGLALRLVLATTGALVALTVGFASVAFVRLVAFVALGRRPRSEHRTHRHELAPVGRAGLLALSAACLALAVVAPLQVRAIARGLQPLVEPAVTQQAAAEPWVLQPVYGGFSALSPSWLWVVMPVLALLVLGGAVVLSSRRLLAVRRVDPWRSASGRVEGRPSYTAFGFANPTRKVLANVLLTRSSLVALERSSGGQVGDETRGAAGAHLGYTSDVVEVVERFVYQPLGRRTSALGRAVRRLQSGRLDAYVAYMLVALLAVIALVAALS
jgi:formate hydrogenlyase subunit 3/multisubunit Na+/H+ antiporter MnhD subunit